MRGAEERHNATPQADGPELAKVEDDGVPSEWVRCLGEMPAGIPPARGPDHAVVLERCSYCGRIGEVVFFDDQLAVVRGAGSG